MSAAGLRYASEFDASGYAVAARRCFTALVDHGLDPAWEPLVEVAGYGRSRTSVAVGAPIELRARRRPIQTNEVSIFHCVPQSWHRLRHEMAPLRTIGHVVWECEQLPSRWNEELVAVDELWVPTEWNRKIFAEAFSGAIHVVPHIVDLQRSTPPPINLASDRPVVAIVSAWDWRKRPDLTIEAALTAFAGDREVVIVVKTSNIPIGWPDDQRPPVEQIADIYVRHPNPPTLIVDDTKWSDAEVLGLLERADCFFSLTSSEGWGLGAFDAATRGTPVVMTGFGGQVEWLGNDHPGLVPFTLGPADHPDTSLFEPGMEWATPNFDDAVDLVRAVIRGSSPEISHRSVLLASELRERFSPQRVGEHLGRILDHDDDDKADVSITDRRVSVESPTNALSVLVLAPVVDSMIDLEKFAKVIASLKTAHSTIEVVVGTGADFDVSWFEAVHDDLNKLGIVARIEQLVSTNEASLRNRLLFAALRDHDWVVWLDPSVIEVPAGLLHALHTTHADVLQPLLVNAQQRPVASSAATDRGDTPLACYHGYDTVTLDGIDARLVLVRADCHREGLVWPNFSYGTEDPRARLEPSMLGRYEMGEIETEGMGLLAGAMGYNVLGLPDVEIIHE